MNGLPGAVARLLGLLVALTWLAPVAHSAYTITGGPGPAPVNSTTPNADYAQLDAIMTQFMFNANVPNAQLAIGYGGRIVYSRAYTASTVERPLRTGVTTNPASANTYSESAYMTAQPNTRFRMASLSKLVTGLGIQQLVLDGKLSLTESAYGILREDPSANAQAAFGAAPADARVLNITVQQLLNHEAGFDRNSKIYSTANCTTFPSPVPCLGHPANQPEHIVRYSDPVGSVKPWPYPYNQPTHQEFVKTCSRHLEKDLPARLLHYTPGAPPAVSGAYFQFYTNIAYCWAERIIAIRAGASYSGYEDYVQKKVLQPAGIAYAALARADNRDRLQPGDSTTLEINEYYDQPGSYLDYAWCDVYDRAPYSPCVVPRPTNFRPRDYGGAGGWVFSAQEYLRMLQSTKLRLRAPHLLDFPASNGTGSDSLFAGPTISAGTSGANSWIYRYSYGAGVTEWRVTATNALLGYFVGHTGSLPGTRSFYQLDDVTPMNWVVTLNTSPDWDYGSCSSATTVPAATKYWCLLQGNGVSENNGATVTSASTTNSIFTQMRAIYGNATKRAQLEAAADLWVDQLPLPCDLDVNAGGAGNGLRNGVADGLMILRAMQGARGAGIAVSASGATGANTTTYDRAEKNARDLVSTRVADIDGDGVVNPAIDGVLLLRAMFGMSGSAVTNGLAITGPRSDWASIRSYLNTRCNATLP